MRKGSHKGSCLYSPPETEWISATDLDVLALRKLKVDPGHQALRELVGATPENPLTGTQIEPKCRMEIVLVRKSLRGHY
jgi:hypothetical protein